MRKTKRKYPRSTACFAFIVRNSIRSYTLISDVYRIQGFGENCETCFRARLSNLLSDEKASVAPLLYSYG